MAKHWSQDMYVLCWCDPGSNGRRRVTCNPDPNKLIEFAQGMTTEHDPVLYTGFGTRKPIPGKPNPKPSANNRPKPKPRPAANGSAPAAA